MRTGGAYGKERDCHGLPALAGRPALHTGRLQRGGRSGAVHHLLYQFPPVRGSQDHRSNPGCGPAGGGRPPDEGGRAAGSVGAGLYPSDALGGGDGALPRGADVWLHPRVRRGQGDAVRCCVLPAAGRYAAGVLHGHRHLTGGLEGGLQHELPLRCTGADPRRGLHRGDSRRLP